MATSSNVATQSKQTTKMAAKAPVKAKGSDAPDTVTKAAGKRKVTSDDKGSTETDTATTAGGTSSEEGTGSSTAEPASKKKAVAVADPEFDRRLKDLITGFDEVISKVRESKQTANELKKTYHQQIKDINKRRKIKRTGATGNQSFQIPSLVRGTQLHDFMKVPHGTRLARQAVNNAIHKYAEDNGLQRKDNKKFFVPDAVLESIIGTVEERRAILNERKKTKPETKITDDVGYFNLQTFIKKWFVNKAEEAQMTSQDSDASTVSTTANPATVST